VVFPSYRRMVHVGSVALALVLLVVLVADHAWFRAVITALATVVAVIAFWEEDIGVYLGRTHVSLTTAKGELALLRAQETHADLRPEHLEAGTGYEPEKAALAEALFGPDAMDRVHPHFIGDRHEPSPEYFSEGPGE